jgi:hypothetical protein
VNQSLSGLHMRSRCSTWWGVSPEETSGPWVSPLSQNCLLDSHLPAFVHTRIQALHFDLIGWRKQGQNSQSCHPICGNSQECSHNSPIRCWHFTIQGSMNLGSNLPKVKWEDWNAGLIIAEKQTRSPAWGVAWNSLLAPTVAIHCGDPCFASKD